jgi:uncharacterized membrane protein
MRSTPDRIRHAVSFEVIGLALIIPLGAWIFHMPPDDVGVVGIGSAVIAMLWNYAYNSAFDCTLLRLQGDTQKNTWLRMLHAILFEAGLLIILVPPIAFYLQISLWEAVVIDIYLAAFFVIYAFVFNLAYDRVFPPPSSAPPSPSLARKKAPAP